MQRSTATRRLVKSPPELWAELSSEDSLGRRLAEFGEIRITRVDPETTVAWEGSRASGTVELEPTGWGTKVRLTATPSPIEPVEPATAAPAPPTPARASPAPGVIALAPRPRSEAAAGAAPRPPVDRPRGFFARLFRGRPAAPVSAIPDPAAAASAIPDPAAAVSAIPGPPVPMPDPSPPTPSPQPGPPAPGPDPTPGREGPDPGPAPNPTPPAPEPGPPSPIPPPGTPQIRVPEPPPEAIGAERTAAILSEVLDDLGSAHHRPFSRD